MTEGTETVDALTQMLRRHGPYTSLQVTSIVDNDTYPSVARLPGNDIFPGDADGYLMLSDETPGRYLRVEERSRPSFRRTWLDEPGIEPVLVDLFFYYLSDGGAVRFETASLYLNPDEAGNRRHLRAIAFHRPNGRALLLDPFRFSGIHIGNEADLACSADDLQTRGGPPVVIRL